MGSSIVHAPDIADDHNAQDCQPGIDKFLLLWTRLPFWWKPLHDRILLELALMHKLDVDKYYQTLEDSAEYQRELEDDYYTGFDSFAFWCTKKVNVQHRLRFLLYVIDNEEYPESMIFLNDMMKVSHLDVFGIESIIKTENELNSIQEEEQE